MGKLVNYVPITVGMLTQENDTMLFLFDCEKL